MNGCSRRSLRSAIQSAKRTNDCKTNLIRVDADDPENTHGVDVVVCPACLEIVREEGFGVIDTRDTRARSAVFVDPATPRSEVVRAALFGDAPERVAADLMTDRDFSPVSGCT